VVILAAKEQPLPYNLEILEALATVTVTDAAGLPAASADADILFLWDFFSSALKEAWQHANRLQWVHVAAAGVDAMMFDDLRASDVVVTNAHGTFDQPIAEFALASILAQDKQLHRSKRLQQDCRWQHREVTRTEGSRVLVVGTGGIGRATGRLLRAVGMEVRGVGRAAREDDPDFGTVLPSTDLAEHAGWADHIILVAPLTGQTRHMMDAGILAAMKPSAHLVNLGRGALVDEPALIQALREGWIAAASLDVFSEEPLPADNPLWGMENVHISAHMCGDVIGWRDALAEQFQHNLERWVAGEGLANVVDKDRGYVSSAAAVENPA
jgi:phosphoglycerate dehydrogenase-like enzyme